MDSAGSYHWRDSADALGAAMNKYKNHQVEWLGQKFRSKRELARYQELLFMQEAGELRDIRREVPYDLAAPVVILGRKRPALRYFADFVYRMLPGGDEVVEDCKGVRTEGYRIKRHLMKSVHGIDIFET